MGKPTETPNNKPTPVEPIIEPVAPRPETEA